MLIDSHHHLWKYNATEYDWIDETMSVIRSDFQAAQLREVAQQNGVDGFVSVQARQSIEETLTLLDIAAAEPLIRGVVGWVPLADPKVADVLDQFVDQAKLKGMRHVVQGEPDDRFILRPDFNRGVAELANRNLVYDVLIFARQLPAAIEFARLHDGLQLVLDHIAKPTISKNCGIDSEWEKNFRELAKSENVICKFSGVVTEFQDDGYDIDIVRHYFDIALDAFTPDRLMFGSDWPVCLLKTKYSGWIDTVKSLATDLSPAEQEKLFSANAIRAYNLS